MASFVLTKDKAFWLPLSDSHSEIITHFKLHVDGAAGPNTVNVEIHPPKGDLSSPLEQWTYSCKQDIKPEWYDAVYCECRARLALQEWADKKLNGWSVHEAFHPINPLLLKPKRMSKKRKAELIKQWDSVRASVRASVGDSVRASARASVGDSVRASVWDSVWASVGASVWDSVWASVWASVGASVGASVWAYVGGLFPNIKEWRYAEKLGTDPWRPLLTLWYAGYVPSFDGKTWRLHSEKDAKVVFEWEAK
jgi:hypothetical protein